MKISTTLAVLVALVALPTVAQADSQDNAAKACKHLRSEMGKTAFAQTFGTNKNKKNAFGKCVSKQTKADDQAKSSASAECKAERAQDEPAFTQKYGTGKNGADALGKCISQKASAKGKAHHDALVNAAKQCRTERSADAVAFKDKYGTNANKANAFGKCVSQKVRQAPTS